MPPQIGTRYRAAESEFWNEAIPVLLRHPNAELSVPRRQKPRPYFLDIADGVGKHANASRNALANEFGLPNKPDGKLPFGYLGKEAARPEDATYEEEMKNVISTTESGDGARTSSATSMVIGFGVVFLLINATAFVYLYHKRQKMRKKEKATLARRPASHR